MLLGSNPRSRTSPVR